MVEATSSRWRHRGWWWVHTKAGEARRTEPPESRERRARARSSDRDVAEQRGSSEPSFRIELKDVARILLYFTGEFRNKPEA